jgi:KaiC/GvpD/RAD55 family RecA-like ATPase
MSTSAELIRRSVRLLLSPGQVVELRALHVQAGNRRGTLSGYFDSIEPLVKAAAEADGHDASGVYITANPTDWRLLSRRSNRAELIGKDEPSTSDRDISTRRHLYVDCDPRRPAGISSSDSEHAAALAKAQAIDSWLQAAGWPAAALADSGNGAHLLYRIQLPNDKESELLVKRVLCALEARFGDEAVGIDQSVYNAARIVKLWGTTARKGDNTKERPHRVSRLLTVPEPLVEVPREQLERLAEAAPEDMARGQSGNGGSIDVDGYLEAHSIDVSKRATWNTGQRWELQSCPWDESHKRSAFIIQFQNGAVAAGCLHSSCREKKWHDLRDAVEGPQWRNGKTRQQAPFDQRGPWDAEARNGAQNGAAANDNQEGQPKPDDLAPLSVGSLLAREEERLELGPVLLPTGWQRLDAVLGGGLAVPSLIVLGAAPKSGKSTWVQIIATRHAEAGGVAYILDLENGRRRILRQILCRRTELGPRDIARALKDKRAGVFESREAVERWQAAKVWVRETLAPNLFIESSPPSHGSFIKRVESLRQLAGERKLLVIVDSLQKLPGEPREDRRTTIDGWDRLFEQLRLRHEVVFLIVSEIRRGKDGYAAREDAFKESGGIEYAADLAMTLNRPAADEDTDTQSTLRVELARDCEEDPRGEVASYRPVRPWYGLEEIEPIPIRRSRAHGPAPEKLDGASEFLREQLSHGPVRVSDVLSRGSAVGFSVSTLQRAKRSLGVKPQDVNGRAGWGLP